jgi:intracellular multiplication protein IcmK
MSGFRSGGRSHARVFSVLVFTKPDQTIGRDPGAPRVALLLLGLWLSCSPLAMAQEPAVAPPAPPEQAVLNDPALIKGLDAVAAPTTNAAATDNALSAPPDIKADEQKSAGTKPAETSAAPAAEPSATQTPAAETLPPVAPAPTAAPMAAAAQDSALDAYLKADGNKAPATSGGDNKLPVTAEISIRGKGFDLGTDSEINLSSESRGDDPLSQIEEVESIRSEAMDAALTGLFPLKPEEIETLLKRYDDTERASQTPPYAQPKPEISVQTISLDPGVSPPAIKTAVGNVTTVNILDMTGAPWPVQDITWAGDFEIIQPEEGGHIIRITPMAKFAMGNMSVRLLTLKTPITFALRAERDSVHYRVDARIPEYGPFAEPQLIDGGAQLVAGSPTLTSILDGVAPTGAEKLDVSGVDGRTTAYRLGAKTYVRTPLTLLSPAWESSVSSADGMNVYALSDTPVLLLSDQGAFQRAKLKEKEELLDE